MELNPGLCGICKCKNAVLKPEGAEYFWKIAIDLYENDVSEIAILKLVENICPSCIYQILQIQKKNDYFKNFNPEEQFSSDICIFCKDDTHLLEIRNPKVLAQLKLNEIEKEKLVSICITCYYVKNISTTLRENLVKMVKISKANLKKRSRGVKIENQNSFDNEIKLVREIKQENHDEKEIDTNPSEKNNKQTDKCVDENSLFTLNISKDKNAILIDSDDESDDTNKKAPLKVTLKGIIYSDENFESKSKTIKRNSQKRKASQSPEKHTKPKSKKFKISSVNERQRSEKEAYDMSRISKLKPLYKSEIDLESKIRQDRKFFRNIPYVKMTRYIQQKTDERRSNKSRSTEPPSTSNKKTPHFKIKLKQRKTKMKKIKVEEQTEDKDGDVFDEIKKKKAVVKVARLELDEVKRNSRRNSLVDGRENGEFSETSKDDLDVSTSAATPVKKKKRVHFNDTPTIIITRDETSEDLTEEEEVTTPIKKKIIKNGKTLEISKENNSEVQEESVMEQDKQKSSNDSKRKYEIILNSDSDEAVMDTKPEAEIEDSDNSIETSNTVMDVDEKEDNKVEVSEEKNFCDNEEKMNGDDSNSEEKKDSDEIENNNSDDTITKDILNDDLEVVDEDNSDSEATDRNEEKSDNFVEKIDTIDPVKDLFVEEPLKCGDSLENPVITGSDEFLEQNKEEVSSEASKSENEVVSLKESSEDFGSLIDEVQKCLTSNKDTSTDSNDAIDLHTDELDELFENDKLKSLSETGDDCLIPL